MDDRGKQRRWSCQRKAELAPKRTVRNREGYMDINIYKDNYIYLPPPPAPASLLVREIDRQIEIHKETDKRGWTQSPKVLKLLTGDSNSR